MRLLLVLTLMMIPHVAMAVSKEEYGRLADEVRGHFDRHVLATWFPACVDTVNGGFNANLSREWKAAERQDRFIVFQARMTWVSAQVAIRRPELREKFVGYTRHGVAMLSRMWDGEHGGLHWGVDQKGQISERFGTNKHAYGISFGIYALAAAYEATRDKAALDLALRTFDWFDKAAHDDANGGYHEALSREGKPLGSGNLNDTAKNRSFGPNRVYGYKSMNSHIHLLEAFTELYRVSKEERVKKRLEELFVIVRDKIAVEPGCLNLYFTPDWRAVPDHDSFGHDVETAYLLIEAGEVLHRDDAAKTLKVARSLVDHALEYGFDQKMGGFYDKGYAFEHAHEKAKVWWTQAEGLNALLLMHAKFGGETDKYWKAWTLTWKFVNERQADNELGGWYEEVDAEGKVSKAGKAHMWKAAYHDGRALMNMERVMRGM